MSGPRLEVLLTHGERAEPHVRMRGAAILGTESVPGVRVDRVRREPEVVRVVRNEVTLTAKLRNPERVCDVRTAQREIDRPPEWQVELVRRDQRVDATADARRGELRIAEFPPPLVAGNEHFERTRTRQSL